MLDQDPRFVEAAGVIGGELNSAEEFEYKRAEAKAKAQAQLQQMTSRRV